MTPGSAEIIDGQGIGAVRHPYVANVVRFDGQQFVPMCGGVLVTDTVVLTSFSCVNQAINENVIQPGFGVTVGCENGINAGVFCRGFNLEDTQIAFSGQPGEDLDPTNTLDSAAIRLPISPGIEPIRVLSNTIDIEPGIKLTTLGYGIQEIESDGSFSFAPTLTRADVFVGSRESCNAQLESIFAVIGEEAIMGGSNFCALGENGAGPCLTESGSPIIFNCGAGDDDVLFGHFVGARGCGIDGSPAIFESISVPNIDFFLGLFQLVDDGIRQVDFAAGDQCGSAVFVPEVAEPTAFPTFAFGEWVESDACLLSNYATLDGCHCNCGALDPDCLVQPDLLFNCQENEECVLGVCQVPTPSPTQTPTVEVEAPLLLLAGVSVGFCVLLALGASLALLLVKAQRKKGKKHKRRKHSGNTQTKKVSYAIASADNPQYGANPSILSSSQGTAYSVPSANPYATSMLTRDSSVGPQSTYSRSQQPQQQTHNDDGYSTIEF